MTYQGANESSSENGSVEKQHQEMSYCDDIDYITPANMSHGDDISGPHQTKESSCEMSDTSHGDDKDGFMDKNILECPL